MTLEGTSSKGWGEAVTLPKSIVDSGKGGQALDTSAGGVQGRWVDPRKIKKGTQDTPKTRTPNDPREQR